MNKVEFLECGEIRMGSPFKACKVRLGLSWSPELPETDWRDLAAESPDGRYIGLVLWDVPGNKPGFVVYTLDNREKRVTRSARQSGCCDQLWWESGEFRWHIAPAN